MLLISPRLGARMVAVRSFDGLDFNGFRHAGDIAPASGACGACDIFRTALGPSYNSFHRDHFHPDMEEFGLCR